MNIHGLEKVFIISAGRTGTTFLGDKLGDLVPFAYSIHEPDRVDLTPLDFSPLLSKFTTQGFFPLTVGKALGFSGSRNLSLKYLQGALTREQATARFLKERRWVPSWCRLYIEANYQLFGIAEVLTAMPKTRIVFVVRDPRTWVRSWMNKVWYRPDDLMDRVNRLGFKRLSPPVLGICHPKWESYGRFEKLCWVWGFMNQRFYDISTQFPGIVKLYRFETLFQEKPPGVVEDMLRFIFGGYYSASLFSEYTDQMKDKLNIGPVDGYPNWTRWPAGDLAHLYAVNGPLMKKLGYETFE